jgi:hypothetical protein
MSRPYPAIEKDRVHRHILDITAYEVLLSKSFTLDNFKKRPGERLPLSMATHRPIYVLDQYYLAITFLVTVAYQL